MVLQSSDPGHIVTGVKGMASNTVWSNQERGIMSWSQHKKAELTEHLFQTALGLFRDEGFEPVTTAMVAAKAGVAKGTFFNHFSTKVDVLKEWYLRLTSNVINSFDDKSPQLEDLTDLASALAKAVTHDIDLWRAKITHGGPPGPVRETEECLDQRLSEFFGLRLEEARGNGVLRRDFETEMAASHFVATLTQFGRNLAVGEAAAETQLLLDRFEHLLSLLRTKP